MSDLKSLGYITKKWDFWSQ